ncbi:MAG: LysE family translocator [Devosia sp.]|jgi:threonine/homoserine/homoserine lactone efflux protein|uniref:LysE family translocator n=1 Tax=Devosia sp. TaxID=1871048 RepID=UPI001A5DC407|nr:LysE family translocator [Devosia sp.]MBL8600089.1 LysE family translocator [Devosia sp.]
MDYAALAAYFAALAALTAAPGPIVAVLVARSVGSDTRGAVAFATGLCLGDVLAVCAIAMGVGSLAQSSPEWFTLAKYAGVAYLLWLAWRIWTDGSAMAAGQPRPGGLLASTGAGLALCLGNPSTVLIYMLLLPTVAPAGIGSADQLLLVLLVTFLAVGGVFFGAILLARQFSRVISSARSSMILSRATALVIAATSLWMLVA